MKNISTGNPISASGSYMWYTYVVWDRLFGFSNQFLENSIKMEMKV